jgi:membrane protein implicated in regulation of membrane protease activity
MHAPESHDGAVLALVAGVVVLATPLRVLWLRDGSPWWLPFAVWAGIVALAAVVARREGR